MYGILTFLITRIHPWHWKMLSGWLFSIFLGIAIEYLQEYIPGRRFEWEDIIANSAGSSCGVILALILFQFGILQKLKS